MKHFIVNTNKTKNYLEINYEIQGYLVKCFDRLNDKK